MYIALGGGRDDYGLTIHARREVLTRADKFVVVVVGFEANASRSSIRSGWECKSVRCWQTESHMTFSERWIGDVLKILCGVWILAKLVYRAHLKMPHTMLNSTSLYRACYGHHVWPTNAAAPLPSVPFHFLDRCKQCIFRRYNLKLRTDVSPLPRWSLDEVIQAVQIKTFK